MTVENLGIAKIQSKMYSSAPNLVLDPKKYNFDISAYNHDVIMNSAFIKPLLSEYVEDPNGTFAVIFPSKRKYYVDNYLDNGVATSGAGRILWTPLAIAPDGIPDDIRIKGEFDSYVLIQPANYASIPSGYLGPKWSDKPIHLTPYPNDISSIAGFFELYGESADTTTTTTGISPWPKVNSVYQHQKRDGLWWAIESDSFLDEKNTPFWVHFKSMDAPSTTNHETCLIIRIGPGDPENQYDIYISLNQKPRVIDYYLSGGEGGVGGPPQLPMQQEFDNDLARILASASKDRDIEVGIMTIAGRLVVTVNNMPMVYTRIDKRSGDDGGKMMECKIPKGKIQIFGTNAETRIVVCPMTFAPLAVVALPLPTIVGSGGEPSSSGYQGCNYKGDMAGSVAELPTPPESNPSQIYGVDCHIFDGDGGGCSPSGFGFHKWGNVHFKKASASTFAALPSTDFYTLAMESESVTTVAGISNLKNGACPFFFRLKGLQESSKASADDGTDVSDYLISVEESGTAPNYFHVKKSASLTFYNPDNVIGASVTANQTAFNITWGWTSGNSIKTFTGIAISVSKSEIAGKETITVNCEDYMYVLNKVPIINSPFYDGMVAVWAIQDLAERAGVVSFQRDFENENEYFLPSGYAFSQPKMKYNSSQMILDCILDMTQRFEAYVYFDGDGKFHINKLPDGLFSDGGGSTTGNFSTNFLEGAGNTILEERVVELNWDSTVNCISVFTIERDTRNAILLNIPAVPNPLLFLRPALINQPALGEIEAARLWANDLGKRVFSPILKTRFKTTGVANIVQPLDMVVVDSQTFRVMSVKRSFNADNNDMNCAYECEWLGGL